MNGLKECMILTKILIKIFIKMRLIFDINCIQWSNIYHKNWEIGLQKCVKWIFKFIVRQFIYHQILVFPFD